MIDRRGIVVGGGAVVLAGAGAALFGLRQMGSLEVYNSSVATSRTDLRQTAEIKVAIGAAWSAKRL